jgi:hypothetical protein
MTEFPGFYEWDWNPFLLPVCVRGGEERRKIRVRRGEFFCLTRLRLGRPFADWTHHRGDPGDVREKRVAAGRRVLTADMTLIERSSRHQKSPI